MRKISRDIPKRCQLLMLEDYLKNGFTLRCLQHRRPLKISEHQGIHKDKDIYTERNQSTDHLEWQCFNLHQIHWLSSYLEEILLVERTEAYGK